LWLDEIWLAQNVRDRGLAELLFQPLANRQIAPSGFLALVEGSTRLFGLNEAALRLVPMSASVLGLVLLWRVGHRFVSGLALSAVLLVAAASPALVWYSGNVKQYAGDVACSLLLVLLGLRYVERPDHLPRALAAGVLGVIAVLGSHAAVLTAFVIGLVLMLRRVRGGDGEPAKPMLAMTGAWAVGAAFSAGASLGFTESGVREFMRDFWSEGFAPWSEGPLAVAWWSTGRLYHILAHFLVFLDEEFGILAAPLAVLAVVGLPALWRGYGVRGFVLLAPVLGALLGGLSGIFPVDHRLAVHAGASLVIVALVGYSTLMARRSRWVRGGAAAMGVLAVLPMPAIVLLQSRPPLRAPDTRAVLEILATRLSEGDTVYAYCYAEPAAEYYGQGVGISAVKALGCPRSPQEVEETIGDIEGGRVWFFYTNVPEPLWSDVAIRALERRGTELDRITDPRVPPGAAGTAAVLFQIE
jgi:hypothetical protein